MGYYLSLFQYFNRLCDYYAVNALAINIGMVTCLAYASVERNYLMFRKNGLLSWRRQWIPIVCLILYSYIMALINLYAPKCHYIPCSPCNTIDFNYMILWLVLSFIIPELVMFSSTMILMYRLYRHRMSFTRTKDENIYYRIVIQMTLYVFWSCLYYCPTTFYNLALIVDPDRFSPGTRSAMLIVSTVSVQSYPILTFILMINYHRRTKTKKPLSNESALRLNVLPTITEPPPVQL